MAITKVNNLGNTTGATGLATLQFTVSATTTIGNLNVVASIWGNSDRTTTVTDSQGNTYQQDETIASASIPAGRIFSSLTTHQLVSGVDWIKITWTGGTVNNACLSAYEFSGVASTSWLDKVAAATATNNSPSSGNTSTTTQASELLFGVVGWANTTATFSAPTLTEIEKVPLSGSKTLETQYSVVSSTGTYASGGTLTSSPAWVAMVATYKAASGGATPISQLAALGVG